MGYRTDVYDLLFLLETERKADRARLAEKEIGESLVTQAMEQGYVVEKAGFLVLTDLGAETIHEHVCDVMWASREHELRLEMGQPRW